MIQSGRFFRAAPAPLHPGASPGRSGVLPRLLAVAALVSASCGPDGPPAGTGAPFVDIAPEVGMHRRHVGGGPEKAYIVEAKGGGCSVLDADGDGSIDIYWVNGATLADPEAGAGNALYLNLGSRGFSDEAEQRGVSGRGWGMGAVAADYDNDGDADLYVTCLRENLMYRNDGASFREVGSELGVRLPLWSTGATFGDYDLDGDLDLYVADYVDFDTDLVEPLGSKWKGAPAFSGPLGLPPLPDRLFRNDGDRFTDVSQASGIAEVAPGYGLGTVFVDYDLDGDADLYVANDSSPNFLFRNDPAAGRFDEVALAAHVSHGAMGNAQAGMGVAWGDVDGDGHPDLLVTNFDSDYNTLYRSEGDGTFEDVSFSVGLAEPSLSLVGFGTTFLDFDLDADLDLFVANGHVYPQVDTSGTNSTYRQADHLYRNLGNGRFERFLPAEGDPFGPPSVSRGACACDFDNDGDRDLFVTHLNDRPSLYRNDAATGNWLGVRLIGRRSNRDGAGARLVAHAGGRRQVRQVLRGSSFLGGEDPRVHFGLGQATVVDSLEIHWPGGRAQILTGVQINGYVDVYEEGPE